MKLRILHPRTEKELYVLESRESDTVANIKNLIQRKNPSLYASRQALRTSPKGRILKDEELLSSVDWAEGAAKDVLFLKDLGPQIGWQTVFLVEYSGPFLIFPLFWLRPSLIYGADAGRAMSWVAELGTAAWCGHYAKRLAETLFIHRFSKGTMPLFNIFKNSGYYWGFAAYVAYFVCHPLYTPPKSSLQVYASLAVFLLAEAGNFSIHKALRDLRPAGSKVRKIPRATGNPFTALFNYVSCPNYTYETIAWLAFAVMTQTLTGLLFAGVGFGQMAIWALGKHRNYRREFSDYPRQRKAIIPFLL